MSPRLLDQLRSVLRRDPSDADASFLLSLAVRDPFVVYAAERERLRRLSDAPFRRTARAELVAEAADELLRAALERRPDSGPMEIVRRGRLAPWRSLVAGVSGKATRRARAGRSSRR